MTDRIDLEHVLRTHLSPDEARRVSELLDNTPIPEIIRLVERTSTSKAGVLFRLLSQERALTVFEALDARHQADLIGALHNEDVLRYFDEMDPDDRVSLLDEVPAEVADELLRTLEKSERDITGVVLGYPRGSVGRRMSPEILLLYQDMTVGDALALLKRRARDLETIYTLPIVDRDRKLTGICSFRDLYTADPHQHLEDIMAEAVSARANDAAESTARWLLTLDHLAMPVTDEGGHLVGLLTFDDAHEIVEEADTEDAARGGGHEPLQQPYLSTPLIKVVRSRIVWLLVLALSAILTVHVLDTFEETLATAVVLALFIPLLTGTAGNTGNQAATTVTRALALGDVEKSDVMRVLWREMRVGFFLGALLGSLGFTLASFVYSTEVGMVIGLTLLAVCTMAASIGGIMPIVAKAIGADPAVFSNPFISTFSDATGLVIYFMIAKAVLGI
ncbi:MAG: magnesium transporter [Actinomycetaceae bacterium]|nr:magnesium transporter [Actinomycetaceae bacterium]